MKTSFQSWNQAPGALLVAGILFVLLATSSADAQGSEVLHGGRVDPTTGAYIVDPTTGAVIPAEPISFDPKVEEHRVDVDFDGVMLADIVDWLRKVPAFQDVNFVLSPRVQDYGQNNAIQNNAIHLKLRSAGLRDILNAIGIATDNRVMFEVRTPALVALIPAPGMDPASPIEPGPPPMPPPPPPTYQVLNLHEILRLEDSAALDQTIETVRELVDQTLKTIHGNTNLAPKLNFHRGSGVLVIVGQPEAIKVTMDIIRNLRTRESQSSPTP